MGLQEASLSCVQVSWCEAEEKGASEERQFLCAGLMSETACAQVVFGAGESSSQHACAGKNTALLMLFVLLVRLVQVPACAPHVLRPD